MTYNTEFNRDTDYWNQFYKENPPASMQESRFARFVTKYIEKNKLLVDIGCGNGRDSLFFNRLGLTVIGIDASDSAISALQRVSAKNLSFICGNFINEKRVFSKTVDYYYSRFTLHAIDQSGLEELIQNVHGSLAADGKFFVEVRCVRDSKFGRGEQVGRNAYILDGHYRHFIVMEELIVCLINMGFHIKYAEQEKDFAPFGEDNPEIIRIVAVKENAQIVRRGGVQTYRKIFSVPCKRQNRCIA